MFRFIVNSKTSQIHDKKTREERCNLEGYHKSSHFKEVGKREFIMLLKEGFDLCDYCFNGKD
jgi:hypothetical protein